MDPHRSGSTTPNNIPELLSLSNSPIPMDAIEDAAATAKSGSESNASSAARTEVAGRRGSSHVFHAPHPSGGGFRVSSTNGPLAAPPPNNFDMSDSASSPSDEVEDDSGGGGDEAPAAPTEGVSARIFVPKRCTLNVRLTLIIFAFFIVAVTAFVTGVPILISSNRITQDLVRKSHEAATISVAEQLDTFFDHVPRIYNAVASAVRNSHHEFERIAELICSVSDNGPVTTVFVLYPNNTFLGCLNRTDLPREKITTRSSGDAVLRDIDYFKENGTLSATHVNTGNAYDPTLRPWYPQLTQGKRWTTMYVNFNDTDVAITFGGHVELRDGSGKAIIGIDVTTSEMRDKLVSSLQRIESGSAFAFDRSTEIIFASAGDDRLTNGGELIMFVANISSSSTVDAARRADAALVIEGTRYISTSSLRDAYNLDVGIVVVSDKAAATKRWRDTVEVILIIFALTTIANFILCYFTGTLLFATPLERLSAAMVRQSVFAWSEGGTAHSRITEIYHAELAFNFLCHETQGLKQFVPFAVSSEEATEVSSFRQHTADGSHTHSSIRPPSSQLLTISSHSSSMNGSSTTGNPLGSRQQARGRTTILQRSVRLNTSRALNFGHVSVLALSMSGFHQRLSDMVSTLDAYAASVAAVVECVVHATTRFRGNLDTFYGDIFLISFNSLHKQSQHKKAAVRTALYIHDALCNSKPKLCATGVATGISCGPAVFGNLGTDDVARFGVVGDVSRQSIALMYKCESFARKAAEVVEETLAQNPSIDAAEVRRHSSYRCLVTDQVVADIAGEMYFQRLGDVRLPLYSEARAVRVEVCAVMADPLCSADEAVEWNYVLSRVSANDPYASLNEAAAQISHRGDLAKDATARVRALPTPWRWPFVERRYAEIVSANQSRVAQKQSISSNSSSTNSK